MKCFKYNQKNNLNCNKNTCRYWIDHKKSKNCCLLANNNEKKKVTLQDIGDIFNVTRMRICQIEKSAINKLKTKLANR